jgi:glutathione S-transferase
MPITLLGSLRSPFVRIPRLYLMANQIDFKFEVINYLEVSADRDYLSKQSPINKVPVLILEDGQKIFESRVIITYLMRTHALPSLTLDEENYVSAICAAMDVYVNLYLLKMGGLDLEATNWYVKRQQDRVLSSLEFVRPWARKLDAQKSSDWNYASMCLYSFAFWADARGILSLSQHPDLESFIERFKNAPGVQETSFAKS